MFINTGGQVFFLAISGTGSTKTAFRLELVALFVYMVYCYVVISALKADVAICWTAEHVYAGALLLCSWRYMKSGSWKKPPHLIYFIYFCILEVTFWM